MAHEAHSLMTGHYELHMDSESHSYEIGAIKKRGFVRVGKVPLPFRRSQVLSDVLMMMLGFAISGCIAQSYWIHRLREGLNRISNDDFDHTFNSGAAAECTALWDDAHLNFLGRVNPVPVHSHNDYTRRIPLFEALASGCISVEADVHLVDGDLLVGHSSRDLKATSNLRDMYLEPLRRMIEQRNSDGSNNHGEWHGLFERDPQQTVVLLIDHKTYGHDTVTELYSQLQPLRELDYLTYWDGSDKIMRPLTIVATGKAPFDSIIALDSSHRDIFWDAPLDALPTALDDFTTDTPRFRYNQSNSHYASTQFRNVVPWRRKDLSESWVTAQDRDLAATQAEQAAVRGLLTRYWDTPISPPNLRDSIWRWLVGMGGGVINMDNMGAVRDKSSGWGSAAKLRM